jgi:dephospho-CoA kinase
MLKVGVTGGIGSGKTKVCQVFETLGIPVLYADSLARTLMETDEELIQQVKSLFGANAYLGTQLNRAFIGSIVFSDKAMLNQLNAITHPAVIAYGENWLQHQQTPYAIKEAALFFESGSDKNIDFMIGISAPTDLRIERTMHRDGISREAVLERIARQMDQEQKMALCDAIVLNDEQHSLIEQVYSLHVSLLSKANQ